MALALQEDVEAQLGRALTTAEAARVAGVIARAEAVVMGFLGCAEEPLPAHPAVTSTVAVMVARVLGASAPIGGVASAQTDDTTLRFTADASSGDVWLSATDKLALRRHRCGGGISSVQMVGERYKITEGP